LARASTLTNPEALASWSGAALRRLGGMMDKLLETPEEAADADEPEERVLGREVPSQAEYGELLHLLTDRGLSILSIYSAALRERFNHPDQLVELYPELKGKVQTLYFPGWSVHADARVCRSRRSAWCGVEHDLRDQRSHPHARLHAGADAVRRTG
jgi:hypothetical protein